MARALNVSDDTITAWKLPEAQEAIQKGINESLGKEIKQQGLRDWKDVRS